VRILIWDFDGTLGYRVGGMWTAALLEVIRHEASEFDVTADRLQPYLQSGFPWHSPHQPHPEIENAEQWWQAIMPVFEEAFVGVGLIPSRARAMAAQVRHTYSNPSCWRLFDDTLPALDQLSSQGWAHVILSNHVPELREIIQHLGLEPYLVRIFNSAETGYEKPHPRAFGSVLAAFPDTTAAWMVGDHFEADIVGAESAGIPGILVRNPHKEAKRFCSDLREIERLVNLHQSGSFTPYVRRSRS
jgi:putative hydrolase of the HAD superfamily